MSLSKSSLSNESSHSHLLTLSRDSQSYELRCGSNYYYEKFISKLGFLFRIDTQDLDRLYQKIQQCIAKSNLDKSDDHDINQLIKMAENMQHNHSLLRNLIHVLDQQFLQHKNQTIQQQQQQHNTNLIQVDKKMQTPIKRNAPNSIDDFQLKQIRPNQSQQSQQGYHSHLSHQSNQSQSAFVNSQSYSYSNILKRAKNNQVDKANNDKKGHPIFRSAMKQFHDEIKQDNLMDRVSQNSKYRNIVNRIFTQMKSIKHEIKKLQIAQDDTTQRHEQMQNLEQFEPSQPQPQPEQQKQHQKFQQVQEDAYVLIDDRYVLGQVNNSLNYRNVGVNESCMKDLGISESREIFDNSMLPQTQLVPKKQFQYGSKKELAYEDSQQKQQEKKKETMTFVGNGTNDFNLSHKFLSKSTQTQSLTIQKRQQNQQTPTSNHKISQDAKQPAKQLNQICLNWGQKDYKMLNGRSYLSQDTQPVSIEDDRQIQIFYPTAHIPRLLLDDTSRQIREEQRIVKEQNQILKIQIKEAESLLLNSDNPLKTHLKELVSLKNDVYLASPAKYSEHDSSLHQLEKDDELKLQSLYIQSMNFFSLQLEKESGMSQVKIQENIPSAQSIGKNNVYLSQDSIDVEQRNSSNDNQNQLQERSKHESEKNIQFNKNQYAKLPDYHIVAPFSNQKDMDNLKQLSFFQHTRSVQSKLELPEDHSFRTRVPGEQIERIKERVNEMFLKIRSIREEASVSLLETHNYYKPSLLQLAAKNQKDSMCYSITENINNSIQKAQGLYLNRPKLIFKNPSQTKIKPNSHIQFNQITQLDSSSHSNKRFDYPVETRSFIRPNESRYLDMTPKRNELSMPMSLIFVQKTPTQTTNIVSQFQMQRIIRSNPMHLQNVPVIMPYHKVPVNIPQQKIIRSYSASEKTNFQKGVIMTENGLRPKNIPFIVHTNKKNQNTFHQQYPPKIEHFPHQNNKKGVVMMKLGSNSQLLKNNFERNNERSQSNDFKTQISSYSKVSTFQPAHVHAVSVPISTIKNKRGIDQSKSKSKQKKGIKITCEFNHH